MSYNYMDLEKITQEEYDVIKERFNNTGFGSSDFGYVNEHQTVIEFYKYALRPTYAESIEALDPNGEWDVRLQFVGGHDPGAYGTIRKKTL